MRKLILFITFLVLLSGCDDYFMNREEFYGIQGDSCIEGDFICSDNVLYQCEAGVRSFVQDCGYYKTCNVITGKCENEENLLDTDNISDESNINDIDEINDQDSDDILPCLLDTTWMTSKEEWVSWGYLKMMGEMGEYDGAYVEAVFTDGKIQLADVTKELPYGAFQNYQGSVIVADAVNYEFININQSALTATIDYWEAMYQFSQTLIPAMKEQSATEAGFGASVWFRHSFIDVDITAAGAVTAQRPRKSCFLALGNTEEVTEGTDTYDVPIGDMYGCFAENIDGSVGEELKMMFKNEFTEDEGKLLEFFNTRSDGTVLAYGDEGYTHLCTCYEPDGVTVVNCWEYTGPGGAEDCPAVVEAAGECGSTTDDDVYFN